MTLAWRLRSCWQRYSAFTSHLRSRWAASSPSTPLLTPKARRPLVVEVKSPELEQLHRGVEIGDGGEAEQSFGYRQPYRIWGTWSQNRRKSSKAARYSPGCPIKVTSDSTGKETEGHPTDCRLASERRRCARLINRILARSPRVDDAIAYEWDRFPAEIRHQLQEAFAVGLTKGVAELNVSDVAVISSLNQTAMDWAASAAEMVGCAMPRTGR